MGTTSRRGDRDPISHAAGRRRPTIRRAGGWRIARRVGRALGRPDALPHRAREPSSPRARLPRPAGCTASAPRPSTPSSCPPPRASPPSCPTRPDARSQMASSTVPGDPGGPCTQDGRALPAPGGTRPQSPRRRALRRRSAESAKPRAPACCSASASLARITVSAAGRWRALRSCLSCRWPKHGHDDMYPQRHPLWRRCARRTYASDRSASRSSSATTSAAVLPRASAIRSSRLASSP